MTVHVEVVKSIKNVVVKQEELWIMESIGLDKIKVEDMKKVIGELGVSL